MASAATLQLSTCPPKYISKNIRFLASPLLNFRNRQLKVVTNIRVIEALQELQPNHAAAQGNLIAIPRIQDGNQTMQMRELRMQGNWMFQTLSECPDYFLLCLICTFNSIASFRDAKKLSYFA